MLFSSMVWGACVLGACVFFLITRLITHTLWAETNEELRILTVMYMFLWSFGVCGGATLVGLPCLAMFLSTSSCEILAVCVALVPGAAATQQHMASFHGFEQQEDTPSRFWLCTWDCRPPPRLLRSGGVPCCPSEYIAW